MLNWVIIVLVVGGAITASFSGNMKAVTDASIESAKTAVTLAIGLIGQMALWLGLMRVLRDGGLMNSIGRALTPVLHPLFPEIPRGHPAMGAMIMNIAANVLGLGNAATPFGLKAMRELETLNPHKGVATNSMALFLAINTSGVAVMPLGVIAIRGAMGCTDAAGIFIPSMIATACSTVVAIFIAKLLERRAMFAPSRYEAESDESDETTEQIKGLEEAENIAENRIEVVGWRRLVMPGFALVMTSALILYTRDVWVAEPGKPAFDIVREVLSSWILPLLMAAMLLYGLSRKVRVYESFVKGAKEGFDIAVMIIPFLVAILVAIAVFRASGALETITSLVAGPLAFIGFPVEALPMALIRPLSGSGALTVLMDTLKTHGENSFAGFVVSVMNGSTETTFYVLAVYLGSIGVRKARHAVVACLAADLTGIMMAVAISRLWWS